MLKKLISGVAVVTCLSGLVGCAHLADDETNRSSSGDRASDVALKGYPSIQGVSGAEPLQKSSASLWHSYLLPGKVATEYAYELRDGRSTIFARANSSASMLRQSVRVEPAALASINFSWKVPTLIPGADLTQRETHDSPARLVLTFEGERSKFSAKNAMLSELARTLTGEELPYATLTYVWCNQCEPDSVFINPRTDRIREIPLESGAQNLGRWIDYSRNIRADYEKAFGEAPGALLRVGIMTDADNTKEKATAWYGPISLSK